MTGSILLAGAGAVMGLMLLTWLISGLARDASLVDLVWGFGFVLVAWTGWWVSEDPGSRGRLLVALTTIWGIRLSVYLTARNLGKGEDWRYRAMREHHGQRFFWVSLVTVFLLQGVVMWVVSLPVQVGVARDGGLIWLDAVGIAVWAIGIFFEAVADWQLSTFKADPANQNRVLDRGLWRNTRHPNYFGDFCVWWGLYLIALAAGAWWTAIGPLLMTAFLLKYSGAGLLEKTIGDRRPGYAEYTQRTNAFFPGPRKF